jgi:hypothetical protein
VGEILMPVRNKLVEILHLHRDSVGHKLFNMLGTFVLVDFSWIFFRAGSLETAVKIIKAMLCARNPWVLFDGSIYNCGLDIKNYWLMIIGIGILLLADYCKYKGVIIRNVIVEQDYWFRCLVIDAAVIVLVVFGIWGSTYDAANFIYFQF